MEPIIKTQIPHSRIDQHIIALNRPQDGLHNIPAMLEVWPREGGIVVTAVKPYDACPPVAEWRRQVTEYGALSQDEFDRYFPTADTTRT